MLNIHKETNAKTSAAKFCFKLAALNRFTLPHCSANAYFGNSFRRPLASFVPGCASTISNKIHFNARRATIKRAICNVTIKNNYRAQAADRSVNGCRNCASRFI